MGLPTQRALSKIQAQNDYSYQLTPTDVLWAARMVMFEGDVVEAPAVLWTMTQRAVYRWERSFAEMLQEFSQPINPRWRATGDFCAPGGDYHGAPECAQSRLDRREWAASIHWRKIPSELTDIVSAWAQGGIPNPVPTAVNFAASRPIAGRDTSVADNYLARTPGARAVRSYGGNVFIAEAKTRDWPSDYVGLRNRDGSITTTAYEPASLLLSISRGIAAGVRFT